MLSLISGCQYRFCSLQAKSEWKPRYAVSLNQWPLSPGMNRMANSIQMRNNLRSRCGLPGERLCMWALPLFLHLLVAINLYECSQDCRGFNGMWHPLKWASVNLETTEGTARVALARNKRTFKSLRRIAWSIIFFTILILLLMIF